MLRFTLLAPEIVEAVLEGQHDPERVALEGLMKPFPGEWTEQMAALGAG